MLPSQEKQRRLSFSCSSNFHYPCLPYFRGLDKWVSIKGIFYLLIIVVSFRISILILVPSRSTFFCQILVNIFSTSGSRCTVLWHYRSFSKVKVNKLKLYYSCYPSFLMLLYTYCNSRLLCYLSKTAHWSLTHS